MNEDLAKLTAAPVEVMVKEKKLLLYPLRFLEWGIIEQWMRGQIIEAAKNVIKSDNKLTEINKRAVMKAATQSAQKISLSTCFLEDGGEEVKFLESFEGMLRVVQLSARDNGTRIGKPMYELSELDSLLCGDIGALGTLFAEAMTVSFPSIEITDDDEEEPENPQEKVEQ